jgi:large subunit ribosomal protein L31e
MAKKVEEKKPELERQYVIPLRAKCRVVARYKKTNKAVKTVKEFLAKHMKIENRDLTKVKLDRYLNDFLWARGIKNPPHKVKVKAIKEGEIVRVELLDLPKKLLQKKARLEKREAKAIPKKPVAPKPADEKPKDTENPEDIKEADEKKEAVKEAGKASEKAQHKGAKHQAGGKMKNKTQPVRKALAK